MLIHTFNSPEALIKFSHRVNKEDQVLLIEDGVYCINNSIDINCLRLMALKEDCQLRGIVPRQSIDMVSYPEWVQICTQADNHLSWY